MQLHLETAELDLLANMLMQRSGVPYERLLEMVLARNLRFDSDDLEALAGLLAFEKVKLTSAIAETPAGVVKGKMESTLALLKRVEERVDEACVMI